MRNFHRSLLFCLFAVAIAPGLFAAEPFIAIADVETGRALVPEGSVVPAGVRFFVTSYARVEDKTDAASRVALVFAYAPESKFVRARKVIEAARAAAPAPTMRYVAVPKAAGAPVTENAPRIITDSDPQTFYLYFEDGSYTSAYRHVYPNAGYMFYGASTTAYSAPGSYYTGTVEAHMSSDVWWGFDPYGYSNSCTIGSSGGSCSTPNVFVQSSGSFSATVDSFGSVFQRFGGCWTNPNSPCLRYYSGTIQITFP